MSIDGRQMGQRETPSRVIRDLWIFYRLLGILLREEAIFRGETETNRKP